MAKKLPIIEIGDPVLRQIAKPVTVFHKKLHQFIDNMYETLYRSDDGAAIAANQVGVLKRVVVIDYEDEYLELINPKILSHEGIETAYEGCLSIPGLIGNVDRAEKITLSYQDRNGIAYTIERSGKMARCIQHELDHLDGVLYIDRMTEDFLLNPDNDEKIARAELLSVAMAPPQI